MVNQFTPCIIGATASILQTIAARLGRSPSSRASLSDQIRAIIDSRVSYREEKLNSMEDNISASINFCC